MQRLRESLEMSESKAPAERFTSKLINLVIKRPPWRKVIFIFSIAGLLYIAAINFSNLQDGLMALGQANLLLLGLSVIAIAITYLTAAGVYWSLSDRKLTYAEMVEVEIAGAFTSRLLPAGLGGVATNLRYVSNSLRSKTAATTIIALNNILSILSYLASALLLVVIAEQPFRSVVRIAIPAIPVWVIIVVIIFVVLATSLIKQLRSAISSTWQKFLLILQGYREKPTQLLMGFGCALGTTIFYLLAFYCCSRAIGVDITIMQAFIAFTLGVTGGTVSPTPGGLGGAELGLYTGLYSTGVSGPDALSIVLVYRLLAFWLPLIPGFLMFRYLLKHKVL
jgi:glycosyltransferase 2 family protein